MISFNTHYQQIWGARWPALEAALRAPQVYAAHFNPYCDSTPADRGLTGTPLLQQPYLAFRLDDPRVPQLDHQQLFDFYPMDFASLLVAQALEVNAGERVLDLCAAPGGKALCLIEQTDDPADIVLNEASRMRRQRLLKVLHDYLPVAVRKAVRVTSYDGSRYWQRDATPFDKILVDAPCSAERHLLNHSKELQKWTPARSRHLAHRQYALLASAFRMLKPGGRIVYATCSISPTENDEVIAKLFKKKAAAIERAPLKLSVGEATEFGWQILPDSCDGWGPMYCAAIRKPNP